MSNVIPLFAAARAAQVAPIATLEHEKLMYSALRTAHKYVSLPASYLLLQVANYLHEGQSELSYGLLSDELGITRKSVIKYVDELEAAGFIRVRRSRISKTTNAINQFEIDFNSALGVPVPKLKLPRKLNEMGSVKNTPPPSRVVESLHGNTRTLNKDKLVPKGTRRTAPAFDTVGEAIESSTKRITRRRAEKVAKAIKPTSQLTLVGVKATWATAMLKHYPRVPPITLTVKEFAMFKARINPLLPSACITEIFDYFVGSWATLRETKFNWLRAKGKDVAIAPSIPELMRYWKLFAQAFADSRMVEANSAARSVRSREEELEDELASAKRIAAKAQAEQQMMQGRLARAEKIAYSTKVEAAEDTRSLSARRKDADRRYNENVELPDWK